MKNLLYFVRQSIAIMLLSGTCFSQNNRDVFTKLKEEVVEIQTFHDNLISYTNSTDDSVRLLYNIKIDTLSGIKGDPKNVYYSIYVGESHKTHTVRWETFLMSLDMKKIFVYDVGRDTYVTLNEWREQKRK